MDSKFKYHRSFFIFDEEDGGFGTENKPSGHVKVEIKEGRGKLFCQVSNLFDDNGRIQYRLFLLKSDGQQIVPVKVGNIDLKKGRGELEWTFDPYNFGSSNLTYDKFNVVAVLAYYSDRENNNILCPLVAYKGDKVKWRQQLNEIFQQEKINGQMLNQNKKIDDIPKKVTDENIENIHKKQEAIEKGKNQVNTGEKVSKDNTSEEKKAENKKELDNQIKADSENESKANIGESIENNEKTESKPNEGEKAKEENKETAGKESKEPVDEKTVDESGKEKENNLQENTEQEKEKSAKSMGKSYSSYNGSKLFDLYTDETSDNVNLNTNCMNCIFSINKNTDKPQIREFTPEELTKQFDLTFERYTPFLAKRTDYTWWKVKSPVHLNNILYSFGIKIPVLFNPLVLMAHYKYNHLIVGIYRDDIRQKDYIVCGIPAIYWVDEKPFGNACRWAQVEGNAPVYGAFGYWIVYINPKTGKILAIDE